MTHIFPAGSGICALTLVILDGTLAWISTLVSLKKLSSTANSPLSRNCIRLRQRISLDEVIDLQPKDLVILMTHYLWLSSREHPAIHRARYEHTLAERKLLIH